MTSQRSESRLAQRMLSRQVAYVLMTSVIGLALFASGTPSPLYGTYSVIWSLSPLVLTLVYATYAFGVLMTLLLAGPVSDHVGRRPVLLVALGSLMASTVMFMFADSVQWLFAARAVQGLATGLALSAASAALLDLHPRRDARAVGLHNGAASAAGMGLGVLISAVIVELLPAPRVLPYVAAFILFAIAFAGTLAMAEPVPDPVGLRLRPQPPAVPRSVRPAFLLAGLGVLSSWSIGGLSLALGPQLADTLFHTHDHLVGGLSVFALAGPAAVSQLVFRRSAPWAGAAIGSLALAGGLLGIVLAAASGSGTLYVIAAIVAGGGFGVAFLGALRALSGAIPPEQRSAVMSAFYLVAYSSLSVPAILAGVLVTPLGLTSTFEVFGSVIAAVALLVAALAWRSRPQTQRARKFRRCSPVVRQRSTRRADAWGVVSSDKAGGRSAARRPAGRSGTDRRAGRRFVFAPLAGAETNLVANPGFETGTWGWNTSGSGAGVTLTQVAGGHSGDSAAEIAEPSGRAATGSTGGSCVLNDSPNWVRVTSPGSYTASLWVRTLRRRA